MWPPLCLLEEDIFFWKFLVHLVEGCSSFGCNSVVFMRGGLQSFYSTILILSPRSTFKLGTLDGKTMELIFHFDGDFSVQSEVVLHGVLWWLSVLRICCCHWSSSSYCCGVGWILGLGNFTCHGHDKKKKKLKFITFLDPNKRVLFRLVVAWVWKLRGSNWIICDSLETIIFYCIVPLLVNFYEPLITIIKCWTG